MDSGIGACTRLSGHLNRYRNPHQIQQRGCHIPQLTFLSQNMLAGFGAREIEQHKRDNVPGMPGIDLTVRIKPLFHGTMISSNEQGHALFPASIYNPSQLLIHCLHGTDDGLSVFDMPDNIHIGQIGDKQGSGCLFKFATILLRT